MSMETTAREKSPSDFPEDLVKSFACNHVVVNFTPDKLSDDDKKKKKKSKTRKQKSLCVLCGEKVKDKKVKDGDSKSKVDDVDVFARTTDPLSTSRDTRRQMFSSTRRIGSQTSLRSHVDACSMHGHKKIKYYCEDHQELCCSVCVNVLHPSCDRVMLIKDEIKTGFNESLCTSTMKALTNIVGSFEQIIEYNKKILESLDTQCEEAKTNRDELRDKILGLLEEFEKKTNTSIKKCAKVAKQQITATINACKDAIQDVEGSLELLEHSSVSQVAKDMFIATQKANSQKGSYALALSDVINHTKEVRITLVPETNIDNIETVENIGRVEFAMADVSFPELLISSVSRIPPMDIRTPRSVQTVFTRSESTSSLSTRQPILQGAFNTRLANDKNTCDNVAVAFLSDSRVVLADMKNCKLKVFDAKFTKWDSVTLSSGPRGVTAVSPLEVAVSLPDESKIQFVSVTKKLKCTRSILTGLPCYGITCHSQDLVVLCYDGFSTTAIQVMDFNGLVTKVLDMSKTGKVMLTKPWDLTLSPDGNQICVTDSGRLVCVDSTGSHLFTYTSKDLDNSRGLAIDHRGRFYVCGTGSSNVHQVSPHGQTIRLLLTDTDISSPQAVCVDSEKGLMVVTSVGSDSVSLYKMTTT